MTSNTPARDAGETVDEMIRQVPEYANLDDATLAVRALISASHDLTVRVAREMRLNLTDMRAILLLSEHGPMSPSALAGYIGITPASMTVLLDRMERAGHLQRIRGTDDRRRVTVTHTAAAQAAALAAWLPAIQEIDTVCASLTEDDRRVAIDLLHRLTAAMQRGDRP